MESILVAVDGSAASDRVVVQVIEDHRNLKEPPELHLLTVQAALVGVNVKIFIGKDELTEHYQEQGLATLKSARELLDAAGVAYVHHIGVGDPAQVIVQNAEDRRCGRIYMGSRGLGAVKGMVLGSVATKVIHLSKVPVLLVK